MPAPGPLHVHPYLFGGAKDGDGRTRLGIRTFGARHFIGRELLIEPSVLPWAANYETMLAFLRVATAEKGYLIPDGDSFGPEDRSLSYRVLHREAEAGDVPLIELQPLLHQEYGFVAEDYVPPERVFDDRMPPADLMPEDQEAKMSSPTNGARNGRWPRGSAAASRSARAIPAGAAPRPPGPAATRPPARASATGRSSEGRRPRSAGWRRSGGGGVSAPARQYRARDRAAPR